MLPGAAARGEENALEREEAAAGQPPGAHLRVLVVEDEPIYREALCDMLNLEGFAADGVASIAGYKAWRLTHACDVLIVDRRLPDGDGLALIPLHRSQNDAPVIVLTALGRLEDRLAGIDADADHYLVKPVATCELVAILRRCQRQAKHRRRAAWDLDTVAWRLRAPGGAEVALTRREVLFLAAFIGKPGATVARPALAETLGEDPAIFDPRRLEIMVRRLRRKVEAAGAADFPLATVYGAGYAFNGLLGQA